VTLKRWQELGWLKPEPTSPNEIANLLAIVERDLGDAAGAISADWRFGIAFNATLKLCEILLRAEGYRAGRGLHHYRTIQAMPLILGGDTKRDVVYVDSCRTKRNAVEYDYVGGASNNDADELISFARELQEDVLEWLERHHPELAP
jgi:hypothetical protein